MGIYSQEYGFFIMVTSIKSPNKNPETAPAVHFRTQQHLWFRRGGSLVPKMVVVMVVVVVVLVGIEGSTA